jgi:predicted glycoside hydrolase/deacetylase ChbG (UPF0249 family)
LATSAGIIHAHLHGPVNRTSMMVVTGDPAKASVQLLGEAPKLKLGLHLVFTDVGAGALAATRSSGLVNAQGRFLSIQQLYFRCMSGKVDSSGVFDEICAQAELFGKLVGSAPSHVDGHHHAHQFPVIRQAMLRAMKAGLLPRVTRRTVEPPRMVGAIPSCRARRVILNMLGRAASSDFRREGVCVNDHFFGLLGEMDLGRQNPWERYLAALPASGSVEWMVHPGFHDESLVGRDNYIKGRVLELAALTSPLIPVQHAGALARCTEDDGAKFATIGVTVRNNGHSADHRLPLLRGEKSGGAAADAARGGASMRALQEAAAGRSGPC